MAEHNEKGKHAEALAKEWLNSKGYIFKEANYRYSHSEIDLIFEFKGMLIFVEVKFRSCVGFGFAEEFVDSTKRRLIIKAADQYIHENDWHKDIRFDIIGVYQDKHGNINFRQFEDAFY